MTAVFADPMFWAGLAFKVALTASIVVVASVAVERSGPFIGSLIASMPTAGGAAMIILAFDHAPAFIAQSTVGGMVANSILPLYALTYATLAQRNSLLLSLSVALAVWLCGVFLSRLIDWTATMALIATAIIYPVTIFASMRFLGDGAAKAARVALSKRDLAWRAGVVTLVVVTVTLLSTSIGSFFSGVFAFFPVAMSSFFIILHTRVGGPVAAAVAAHVQAPLIGLTLALFAVHGLAEVIGVWWAYLLGLAICAGWNALLWLWKNRQR